jgi:hypothetical protein
MSNSIGATCDFFGVRALLSGAERLEDMIVLRFFDEG